MLFISSTLHHMRILNTIRDVSNPTSSSSSKYLLFTLRCANDLKREGNVSKLIVQSTILYVEVSNSYNLLNKWVAVCLLRKSH